MSLPTERANSAAPDWSPQSWRSRPMAHAVEYPDAAAVESALQRLRALPPLVTSFEVERLRQLIADAQQGRRFLLQGGDCAETLADCGSDAIARKLKIMLQMSLVLIHGLKRPVIRVGRIAGQYAKPRSSPTETRAGVSLPSYFGDLVNDARFDAAARRPDPDRMVEAYYHAGLTLNFIRGLLDYGFADLHHPDYWDLRFFGKAGLTRELRDEYQRMSEKLAEALRFMEALGETQIGDLTRVEFFTSHEGLNLWYESAQTRSVPRRAGHYDLTCHLPWIGERTRQVDGAHVEFFRGVSNPVGVKIGPSCTPIDLLALIDALNPANEPGRLVLIHRMGVGRVRDSLPPLLDAVRRAGRRVLWVCDPMHGNAYSTASGVKTRDFGDILGELTAAFEVHRASGTILGGVHFEMTGEDVTECVGGASGVKEEDLGANYSSLCDPRLNYEQAMEVAFAIARQAT